MLGTGIFYLAVKVNLDKKGNKSGEALGLSAARKINKHPFG